MRGNDVHKLDYLLQGNFNVKLPSLQSGIPIFPHSLPGLWHTARSVLSAGGPHDGSLLPHRWLSCMHCGTSRHFNSEYSATAKHSKKQGAEKDASKNEKLIAQNRKARHDYHVLETLECGIVLTGSEVKSLRGGLLSMEEAYGRVQDGELWLIGTNIQEYSFAHQLNHVPKRPRKLLLHRREIQKFAAQAYEKNLTLVPLKMYFKRGRAKVLMGICRGKKLYDKRESLKKKVMQRDIERGMRR